MTTKAGAQSEVNVLVKEARKNGFKTVPAPGGHKKFVDHHGKPVTDRNGPVIISSSPGDFRWREMTVKRLLAAGVIKRDPFDANPDSKAVAEKKGEAGMDRTGRRNRIADPDVQAKKVEAIKAKSRRDGEATQKLRERWEPIIVKIGGWGAGKNGIVRQLADASFWLGKSRGFVERFPSENSARSAWQNMKSGHTLGERTRPAVEFFIEELEKAKDPRERYFEIVRLSKGLPAREEPETLRVAEKPKEVTGADEVGTSFPAPRKNGHVYVKPHLALEAVAQMMVGRSEVDPTVLEIGQKIQDLELAERGIA